MLAAPAGTTGRSPMSSRYIETSMRADRDGRVDAGDLDAEALGQPHAAALEAHEHDAVESAVAFEDLVGHPGQRPPHVVGVEHLRPALAPVAAVRRVTSSFRPGLTGPASRSDGSVHEPSPT